MYFGILSERVKAVDGNMLETVRVYWDRGGVSVPRRRAETHKGDYGKLLIVGGSVGYTGAPNLCARSAVRSGAGLVYLGVPEAIWSVCAVKNDEAMPFPLPCDASGKLTADALAPLREYYDRCGVLALGPGLGRSDGTAALTAALIRKFPGKIVLDADALWAVSLVPDILREAKSEIVITPHEGEFLRLGGSLENGRKRGAWEFARRYGCVTVLKGHRTIIAHPAGRIYVIEAGNPGMAKGGSGDVLAGMLLSLLGQGCETFDACCAAVWLHGRAGDLAVQEKGQWGMTPTDLLERLPQALREVTE